MNTARTINTRNSEIAEDRAVTPFRPQPGAASIRT